MDYLFSRSHVLIAHGNHYTDRPGGAGRLAWDEDVLGFPAALLAVLLVTTITRWATGGVYRHC